MELALVVVVLIWIFRSASSQEMKVCRVLSPGANKLSWIVRIYRDGQTAGHGVLVSRSCVLSPFSPFLEVAQHNGLVSKYEMIAYSSERHDIFCYQLRKPSAFIPPPEWPELKIGDVRNVAFWELHPIFDVSDDFPFVFPFNNDVSKLKKAVNDARVGINCDLLVFEKNDTYLEGWLDPRKVQISNVSTCEHDFCSEGICDWNKLYDFCTEEKRYTRDDIWQLGGVLNCQGEPTAIMGLIGQGKAQGRSLFISLLSAWAMFKKKPIDTTPAEGPTTLSTSKSENISTTPTAAELTTSTSSAETATTETIESTTAGDTTTTNKTETTILTSRLPPPKIASHGTSEKPTFLRTRPKRVEPASGSSLVIHPTVYAVCVVALYEGG